MDLITIEEANDQLRLDLEGDDSSPPDYSDDIRFAEIERMIAAATAAAEDYMASYIARETPTWNADTAPPQVKAATLMILSWLWEHRGDEDADAEGYLSVAVKSLLHRYHDPVCA
jgi:hypothetical protein